MAAAAAAPELQNALLSSPDGAAVRDNFRLSKPKHTVNCMSGVLVLVFFLDVLFYNWRLGMFEVALQPEVMVRCTGWPPSDWLSQKAAMVICSAGFFVRQLWTVCSGSMSRAPDCCGEVVILGLVFIPTVFWSLTKNLSENPRQPAYLASAVGLVLFFSGMAITTIAEVQRKTLKKSSPGKIVTGGLWAYSMHVNYFGELVCYTGWVVVTKNWWNGWIVAVMAVLFVFWHIPGLDEYLVHRYGAEAVEDWRRRGAKNLIPFVW
eukprot:TRINITY_DN71318_c0_g1_i1.p1 TRINITY_DN71318_c0_g1~~TRINITY_DN71318_c0_g1_i1.p1  ORF type:complete len:276 (+),score=23.83 TRINITY_DN71318_c0_g1_i1:40-828(+)